MMTMRALRARTLIALLLIAVVVGCRSILAISDREPCVPGCLDGTRVLECHGDDPPSLKECPVEAPACVSGVCSAIPCGVACKNASTAFECAPDGSIRGEKTCPDASPFCSGLGTCSECPLSERCGPVHPSDGKAKGCYHGAACIGPTAKIYAGRVSSCLVDEEGAVFCWGINEAGEVGTVTNDPVPLPVEVKNIPKMESLALGYYHTCGITKAEHNVWCWGSNYAGQLGTGSANLSEEAQPASQVIGLPGPVRALTAGSLHNCVIAESDSTVWCWGYNDFAQCGPLAELDGGGRPRAVLRPIPHPDVTNATSVVTVKEHTCALRSVEPYLVCWGDNQYGQLGPSTSLNAPALSARAIPIELPEAGQPIAVAPSFEDVCAVFNNASGTVWCWGLNRRGQRGNGKIAGPEYVFDSKATQVLKDPLPSAGVPPAALINVTRIFETQGSHRCIRKAEEPGEKFLFWCWGGNDRGELGYGELPTRGEEIPYARSAKAIPNDTFSFSTGDDHTCFIAGKTGGPYRVACTGETRYLGAIEPPLGGAVDPILASEIPLDVRFPPRPVAAP